MRLHAREEGVPERHVPHRHAAEQAGMGGREGRGRDGQRQLNTSSFVRTEVENGWLGSMDCGQERGVEEMRVMGDNRLELRDETTMRSKPGGSYSFQRTCRQLRALQHHR